jgi:hypothetical protein
VSDEEKTKIEWVKALGPYIAALFALVGVIINMVVANNALKAVVARIDEKIIPSLESKVNELIVKVAKLEEHNEMVSQFLKSVEPRYAVARLGTDKALLRPLPKMLHVPRMEEPNILQPIPNMSGGTQK